MITNIWSLVSLILSGLILLGNICITLGTKWTKIKHLEDEMKEVKRIQEESAKKCEKVAENSACLETALNMVINGRMKRKIGRVMGKDL
jgi:hypothetical protein